MKNSLNRAALFDMTFLMLVYSTQCFGIEVIKNAMKKQPNDFIRRWINDFMLESSNSNKDLFTVDNNVDNLMQQLHNGDLRTQVVKWQNVCCRLVPKPNFPQKPTFFKKLKNHGKIFIIIISFHLFIYMLETGWHRLTHFVQNA